MHSCSALPFLSLICQVTDSAKHSDRIARALPAGVCDRATRSAVKSYNCGPSSCRSCMPCKMSCTSSHQLAFGLYWFSLASSKSSSRNMVTACNNSRLSRLTTPSSADSTKSFSWLLSPVLRHCINNTSLQLYLTVFRRLLLCPISISSCC